MELILIVAAFFTSTLAGVIGMGGGILLLTIMAEFLSPLALIPIHGVVQLSSNTTRAYFNLKHIDWKIAKLFLIGTIIGAAIGSQFVLKLPREKFMIMLGIAVLILTWMPKFKTKIKFKGKFFFLGGLTAFMSLFIGATGPITAPFFLNHGLKKHAIVATKAVCQVFTHSFKLITFIAIGFAFKEYVPLLIGMVIASAAGSYCGKLILGKVPEKIFRILFKVAITVLAGRLVIKNFI